MAEEFKRVLLFTAASQRLDMQAVDNPICGIGYIAEALRRNDIQYHYSDLRFKDDRDNFLKLIERIKPDLVGTTMYSLGYRFQYRFLEQIKSSFPLLKIVAGGPHISCFRESALGECGAIDYGVTYDGDDTIIELCKGVPAPQIKGLLYRQGSEIKYSGDRPFIFDLDRLGFPLYEGFRLKDYPLKNISVSTSRGCFGECTFCAVATTHGRKIRLNSAGLMAEEIAYWYTRGYRLINIVDDNFTVNRQRVLELCGLLEARRLKGLQIKLDLGVRADCVDEEILNRMSKAGFNKVSFGVESANEHILKRIKKGETLAQIEKAIKLALKAGMQVHLYFIIGLPGETEKEVQNSIDFAKRMKVHNFQFFNLAPYPGTELFDWAKSNGYLLYPPEEYLNFIADYSNITLPLIETPELSRKMRQKFFLESGPMKRTIIRQAQTQALAKKIGRPLAWILILVYTSAWFERKFHRSFLVRKYLHKLRCLLCI